MNPLAPEFIILSLSRETSGSARLDLAIDKDYILSIYEGVQLVDTGFKGPLFPGTFGLIIWRSSNCKKKFEALPGVIDSDFRGRQKL